MEPDFWRERWREGRIAFHRGEPHPLLVAHCNRFAEGGRILVPLAGKSLDIRFLLERGHEVVAVELVEDAVRAFFDDLGETPVVEERQGCPVYLGEKVTFHVADFFETTPGGLGRVDGIYDRASLVALPPAYRARYAAHLASLAPYGSGVLMITVDYDRGQMSGPPFSVPPSEVEAIFGGPFEVFTLDSVDGLDDNPVLRERGLTRLGEHALWLRRRV